MKINKFLICIFAAFLMNSCNYLDIVPDENATEEDAFKNPKAAERYLYSCYSYIPDPRAGSNCLDLFTGDEVVTPWEHETFGKFVHGDYTPSNPVINYWNDLYKGLRQCYLFKENIDNVSGLSEELKSEYNAEIDFLIAYYHFYLIRTYGPVILVKELQDINELTEDKLLPRTPYDECVKWVADEFYKVASKLPIRRNGEDYGRATGVAAMALRARLLLYAASPQFNGGDKFKSYYSDFKNNDGTQLISTTYDPQKWVDAANAYREAIEWAEKGGYELYYAIEGALPNTPEPNDLTQRSLRFTFIDKDNTNEVIWAFCSKEGDSYGIQGKSCPRWGTFAYGGLSPTLRQIERFYTENGLPIDEDPKYDYNRRYDIVNAVDNIQGEGETLLMNTHREPRFYAWIAYHNGFFEVKGEDKNSSSTSSYATKWKRGKDNSKNLLQFTKLSNMGVTSSNTQGTKSGYLNKKGANPATSVTSSGLKLSEYPWPVIRLAELYLGYAEACVECNNLPDAITYLDYVRERAGIPGVEEAWSGIAELNQDKLREIVRRERQIELYLENQNFWDLRRWGIAESLGEKPMGLSVQEKELSKFAKPIEIDVQRRFVFGHYLMPLPISEVNKNPNLVQNPGY